MYIVYNIVPIGFIILLIYIFIDIFLDYFRKSNRSNVQRVALYSFLFYLLSLIQLKFGGITLPPQNPADTGRSFIFTDNWFEVFDSLFHKMFIGGPLAILYNVIIFIPLGLYLAFFYSGKHLKKAISIIVISCIAFEISRLLLGLFGLIMHSLSRITVTYMLFNLFGAIMGLLLWTTTMKICIAYKKQSKLRY